MKTMRHSLERIVWFDAQNEIIFKMNIVLKK